MSERGPRTKRNTLETLDALTEKGKKKKAPLSEKKILSATGKSSKLFSEKLPRRPSVAAAFEGFKPEQKQALDAFAKETFAHPTKSASLQKIPKKRWRDTAREKISKESIGALRDNLSLETKNLLSRMKKKFAAPEALPRPKNAMPVPPIDPRLWHVLKSGKGNDIEFRSPEEPLLNGVMQSVRRPESLLEKTKRGFQERLKGLKENVFPDVSEVPSVEWSRGIQSVVAETFAQPETGAASGVVELPVSKDDMSHEAPKHGLPQEEFGTGVLKRAAEKAAEKKRSQKKEKPKEEQLPEHVPNPELERLIEQAEKGSGHAPRAAEGAVVEKAAEKAVAGNDSWERKLGKMDTLVVNGDDGREEESVSDDRLKIKTVLAKIVTEKKLFRADIPDILRAIGGREASPEAIKEVTELAAGKLSGTDYNYLIESIGATYPINEAKESTPELNFIREKLEKLHGAQTPVAEGSVPAPEVVARQAASEVSEKPAEAAAAPEEVPAVSEQTQDALPKEGAQSAEENPALPPTATDLPEGERGRWSSMWEPISVKGWKDKFPGFRTEKSEEEIELNEEERRRFAQMMGSEYSTRGELKKRLVELVEKGKGILYEKKEGASERYEKSKERIAQRSEELGEKAKGYGSAFVGYLGSKIEQYNKLKGWQKLAITAALMTGSALTGGAPAIGFTTALWLQRGVGAIGMGMNKRKKLDAEIAANPEHRLAGKSETRKNIETALWSAGYMAATSFAVHEGVEGIKAAANSEWLPDSVDWLKTAAQDGIEKWTGNPDSWLGKMLGHGSAQSDLAPEELAALAPSTDALETLTPIPDMPEAQPSPYADSDVQEHIDKAREAIERMQKLTEEQANILKTMPDGSETHPSDISGSEKPFYDSDNVEEAETFVQDQAGAESSAPVVGEEFGPQKDAYMDQDQELKAILEKQQLSGQLKEAPFGLDPIDGHPMSELEAQKLTELRNAMHDPRETGAWPPGQSEGSAVGAQVSGEHFIINEHGIEIPTAMPHIYADAEGHLSIYGGSIEEKIDAIQKFLTENPDKIVYGTDDNGNYRIPWYLHEGQVLPGEPVRTDGFLGFGKTFMDASKPEEFVQKIK